MTKLLFVAVLVYLILISAGQITIQASKNLLKISGISEPVEQIQSYSDGLTKKAKTDVIKIPGTRSGKKKYGKPSRMVHGMKELPEISPWYFFDGNNKYFFKETKAKNIWVKYKNHEFHKTEEQLRRLLFTREWRLQQVGAADPVELLPSKTAANSGAKQLMADNYYVNDDFDDYDSEDYYYDDYNFGDYYSDDDYYYDDYYEGYEDYYKDMSYRKGPKNSLYNSRLLQYDYLMYLLYGTD